MKENEGMIQGEVNDVSRPTLIQGEINQHGKQGKNLLKSISFYHKALQENRSGSEKEYSEKRTERKPYEIDVTVKQKGIAGRVTIHLPCRLPVQGLADEGEWRR